MTLPLPRRPGAPASLSVVAMRYHPRSSGSPALDYIRGLITRQAYEAIWVEYDGQWGIDREPAISKPTDWRFCRGFFSRPSA